MVVLKIQTLCLLALAILSGTLGAEPLVQILDPSGIPSRRASFTLIWEALPDGSPLEHAEISVDGALVAYLELETSRRVVRTDTVDLPRGAQTVTVAVFDRAGTKGIATVRKSGMEPVAPAKTFVLSLGISHYRDPSLALDFAAADARAFAVLFPKAEILLLTDEQVTREALETARSRFLSRSGPLDRVMIFVAGHGITRQGRFSFLTWGADPSRPWGQGVSTEDLKSFLLAGVQMSSGVLLIDACFAGQVASSEQNVTDRQVRRELTQRMAEGSGWYFLTASSSDQPSAEDRAWGHGVLMASLLRALKPGTPADTDHDGVIRLAELDRWLKKDIPLLTHGAQTPESSSLGAWMGGVGVFTKLRVD